MVPPSAAGRSDGFAWEEAKQPSQSPRAAGALLRLQARATEDLRKRESRLRAEVSAAEQSGDVSLLYQSHHRLGLHLEAEGTLDAAERSLREAAVTSAGDSTLAGAHAAATNDHGVVLARLGRHDEAAENFLKAYELAKPAEVTAVTLAAKQNQGLMAWVIDDDRAKAQDLWDDTFRAGRERDDPAANAHVLNNVAVMRLIEGGRDEALQLLSRAELLAQRAGDIRSLAFANNNIGLIYSGPPQGDHFAAIPFAEMALALLTGPTDILARLYVLNNNIIIYEQAHLEPARLLRTQLAETLKAFTAPYPSRSLDIEQIAFSNSVDESVITDREWTISARPVLLRSCARCGVHE